MKKKKHNKRNRREKTKQRRREREEIKITNMIKHASKQTNKQKNDL